MEEQFAPVAVESEVSNLKIPPHSVEAEQSVLGGLLLSSESWERVADLVSAEDFYRSDHRSVFSVMAKLAEADQPLDVITVADALADLKELEQVGGLAYLGELANNTPSASNVRAYATIVRERAILRQLIRSATSIADNSFFPEGRNSGDILEDAERQIMAIAEGRPKAGGPQPVNPLLKGALDRIDELFNTDGSITGVSTGFKELDEKTAGMQRSDLIIVAGRPSMGKTSFAMNIVENAVMVEENPVLVFSMEMSAESLIMRMLSSIGKIEQNRIRTGAMHEDDWPRLSAAVGKLKDRPLFIDDTPALSPSEVRSRARRVMREHGKISMIMIDYLQLMQTGGSEGRTAEISEISRSLKAIAKEFDCPMIALSQLNRSVEQRPNKRPVLSDLRESGAIEQDADVIAFIYRDEFYNEDSPEKGVAEIIIGKQRNGPTGTCKLAFLGPYTRFENLAYASYQPPDE
ncbi:MAG: replicative DNA helicase [Pseudomonadales bacterium]